MVSESATDRIIELVEAALACDLDARPEFLARACGGDGALRGEVESLLGFQGLARGFLESPPTLALDVAALAAGLGTGQGELAAGTQLGEWRVLALLGEGGMGEVYLAQDTVLERRVALKLLRRGMGGVDADTLGRRFAHERRVLAALTHPHIARLYGGAVSAQGRPFLVMEYVEGERLDDYCTAQNLSVPARLVLFRKVCAAVAYAHQNLVIHRDLKPGNILVTTEGEPKLLDFGIAKLLDVGEGTGSAATVTLAGAMTPGYASPEQWRGEPITTASDIYSLGVVLYELLTGQRPPAPAAGAATERPSAAVARAARNGQGASAARLGRRLRGDLDNIVLMAMRAEPARRYASVGLLSEDLRRHGAGLPVLARRDTLGYRAGKFVRRNKVAVAAAVLLLLSLLAGFVATSREAARANRRFDDVRHLANAILFEVDPLMANLPGSTAARAALVRHAREYLDRLSGEAADPALRRELATAYEKVGDVQGYPNTANLGDMPGALASYAKAAELLCILVRENPRAGPPRDELATNYEHTGYVYWWMNQTTRARAAYDRALTLRRALLAEQPRSADYRRGLALLSMYIGDIPAWDHDTPRAMSAYDTALPLLRGLAAEQPENDSAQIAVARCLMRIGEVRTATDDFVGALAYLTEAQGIVEPISRRDPANYEAVSAVWYDAFRRCELYMEQGSYEKAAAIGPSAIAVAEGMVRADPQNVEAQHRLANSHEDLAEACLALNRSEESVAEETKALEIDGALCDKSPENSDYKRACAVHRLYIGKAQLRLGRLDEAAAQAQAACTSLENVLSGDSTDLQVRRDLADAYRQIGKIDFAQGRSVPASDAFARAVANWQAVAAVNPLNKGETDTLKEVRDELAAAR